MSDLHTRGCEGLPAGSTAAPVPTSAPGESDYGPDHSPTPESATPFPFAFTPAVFSAIDDDDEDGISGLYRHLLADDDATGAGTATADGIPSALTTSLPPSTAAITDGAAGDLLELWASVCRQNSSGGNVADTMMPGGPLTASPACPGSPPPVPSTAAAVVHQPALTHTLPGASNTTLCTAGAALQAPPGGCAALQQQLQQVTAVGAASVPALLDITSAASPPAPGSVLTAPMQQAAPDGRCHTTMQHVTMHATEHAAACGSLVVHQQLPAPQPTQTPQHHPPQVQQQQQPHQQQQSSQNYHQHVLLQGQFQQHQQQLGPPYSGSAVPDGAPWRRSGAAALGDPPTRHGSTPLPTPEVKRLYANSTSALAGLASAKSLPCAAGRVAGGWLPAGRNEGLQTAAASLPAAAWHDAPQSAGGGALPPTDAVCRPGPGAAPAQHCAHRDMQMQDLHQHQPPQPQVAGSVVQAQLGGSWPRLHVALSPNHPRPILPPCPHQHQLAARPSQQRQVQAPHPKRMPGPSQPPALQRQHYAPQGQHPNYQGDHAPAAVHAAVQPVDVERGIMPPRLCAKRSALVGPSAPAGIGRWTPTQPQCGGADAAAAAPLPPHNQRSGSFSGAPGDGTSGPGGVGLGNGFGCQPPQQPAVYGANRVQTGPEAWRLSQGYQGGHAPGPAGVAPNVRLIPPRPASEPAYWVSTSAGSLGHQGCSSTSDGNSASGGANSSRANVYAHGSSSDHGSQPPKDLPALKRWLMMIEDEVHMRKRPRHLDGAHEQEPMAPPQRPPAPMPVAPAAACQDGQVPCNPQPQLPNGGTPAQLPPRGPGGSVDRPMLLTAPPPRRATDTGMAAWPLQHRGGSDAAAYVPCGRNGLPADADGPEGRSRKGSLSADGAAWRCAPRAAHQPAHPHQERQTGLPAGGVAQHGAHAQGAANAAQARSGEPGQPPEMKADPRVAALRQGFRKWLEQQQQQQSAFHTGNPQQVQQGPGHDATPIAAYAAFSDGAEKPAEVPDPQGAVFGPAPGPAAAGGTRPLQQGEAGTSGISVHQLQQQQRERLQQQRHERLQKQLQLMNELQLRPPTGSRPGNNAPAGVPPLQNAQLSSAPALQCAGGAGTRQPAPSQFGRPVPAVCGSGPMGEAQGHVGPSPVHQPCTAVQHQPEQQQQLLPQPLQQHQLMLQQQQQQQQQQQRHQQLLQQQKQQQEMLSQRHHHERLQQQQLQQQQQLLWSLQQQGPFVAPQAQQQLSILQGVEMRPPHQNSGIRASLTGGPAAPHRQPVMEPAGSCPAAAVVQRGPPHAASPWVQDQSAQGLYPPAPQQSGMVQTAHMQHRAHGHGSMPQQPQPCRQVSQPCADPAQQRGGAMLGAPGTEPSAALQAAPMHLHAHMLAAAHPATLFGHAAQVPPQVPQQQQQQQWHQLQQQQRTPRK